MGVESFSTGWKDELAGWRLEMPQGSLVMSRLWRERQRRKQITGSALLLIAAPPAQVAWIASNATTSRINRSWPGSPQRSSGRPACLYIRTHAGKCYAERTQWSEARIQGPEGTGRGARGRVGEKRPCMVHSHLVTNRVSAERNQRQKTHFFLEILDGESKSHVAFRPGLS